MNERGKVVVATLLFMLVGLWVGFAWGDHARKEDMRECLQVATQSVDFEPTPEHWDRLTDWCTQP